MAVFHVGLNLPPNLVVAGSHRRALVGQQSLVAGKAQANEAARLAQPLIGKIVKVVAFKVAGQHGPKAQLRQPPADFLGFLDGQLDFGFVAMFHAGRAWAFRIRVPK